MDFKKVINTFFVGFIKKPKIEYVSLVKRAANQNAWDTVQLVLEGGESVIAKSQEELNNIVTKINSKQFFNNMKDNNMKIYKAVAKTEEALNSAKERFEGEFEINGLELVAKGQPEMVEGLEDHSYDDGEVTLFFCKSISQEEPEVEQKEEAPVAEEVEKVEAPQEEPKEDISKSIKELLEVFKKELSDEIEKSITALKEDITKTSSDSIEELTKAQKEAADKIETQVKDIEKKMEDFASESEEIKKFAKVMQKENETLKDSPAPKPPKTPANRGGSNTLPSWME